MIRNHRAPMQYRRFGKTGQRLSVVTLGGMRYANGWGEPRDQPSREMIEQCARITRLALDAGINHIETAHGYGKSEHCYGRVLAEELAIPRDRYHLMTKGGPRSAGEVRALVEAQLKALRTDRIDLYAWHGINSEDTLRQVCAAGGAVEALLQLKAEGVIGAVGFSTHGPVEVICDAIGTGLFDFVNLHYYYFFQRNWPAVALAEARDMGVFIISPNDKGGQLFNPPPLLRRMTAPATPLQWNARFCLRTPAVHTLSFGFTEPAHLDEMAGMFPVAVPLSAHDQRIEQELDARVLIDPVSAWEGHEMRGDPSGINIPEVLRFRRLARCYDMHDFGVYRYNMLESKGDWFPGVFATEDAIAKVDATKAPEGIDVKALLREAHRLFHREKKAAG
jgi:predicted aldo/keto reductase-like oxidoreductase